MRKMMAAGNAVYPAYSLDFERSSSQYLSMTDANFGAYDRAKWAFSVWAKRESAGSFSHYIAGHMTSADFAFRLGFENDNFSVYTSIDGGTNDGKRVSNATYTSTSSWHHLMVHYDSANATAADRLIMWVNGSRISSFLSTTNPSGSAMFNSASPITIGRERTDSGSNYFDGLLFQPAFFSGVLPSIGQVYSGGRPLDVRGLSGLYALLDGAGASAVSDYVLATDWTNNGTVTVSGAIPPG